MKTCVALGRTSLKNYDITETYNFEIVTHALLKDKYRQTSNISCTKSQNLNESHLVLQLSLTNLLKQYVKLSI